MKKIFLFLSLISNLIVTPSLSSPLASRIAVKNENARESDFRSWTSSHPDHTPLSQFWLRNIPGSEKKQDLFDQFERARTEELEGNLAYAQEIYSQIKNLFFDETWATDTILIFQRTFLALAQINTDSRAVELSWFFKCGGRIEDIPAKLKLDAQKVKATEQGKFLKMNSLPLRLTGATHLILNGRVWNLAQRSDILIPPGKNRVTVVGDHFVPITKLLSQSELPLWRPKPRALSDDTCGEMEWPSELKGFTGTVFLNAHCTLSNISSGGHSSAGDAKIANFDMSSDRNLSQMPSSGSLPSYPNETNSSGGSFLKNPYVWAGVAILVGAVAYSSLRKPEPQVETVRIARP